ILQINRRRAENPRPEAVREGCCGDSLWLIHRSSSLIGRAQPRQRTRPTRFNRNLSTRFFMIYTQLGTDKYVMRLESGDDILQSLRQFATAKRLSASLLEGVGSLSKVKLDRKSTRLNSSHG